MEKEKVSTEQKQEKSSLYKLGIGLLIISFSIWLIPIITPFTPLPTKVKAVTITISIIIAEVMFWIGALLVGKEVAAKFKSYLNPKNWRKNSEVQKHEKYSKSDQSND
ncbi:transporter suffix domain-containing protein [Psychrobacillus psychrodurans]|uniref:Transporter suffix domain-containing protein n=1 Tax=Psychrobacillus psychrodurans TaxID=126157 RepID=A0A9X3L809_9BACI|nr:transporter suffix domain-containing protein [Psychrobacillus psychrodurans]MCZ8532933.1 transporter suffix domain-containing protein [Psychrobacillus psychrodurans]